MSSFATIASGTSRISNAHNAHAAKATQLGERLSRGTRLISPSVDASSFAMTTALKAKVGVLEQAHRNVTQGAAVLNIAVGGMEQIAQILEKLQALTTKANNDFNAGNIADINKEYTNLLTQIDAIVDATRIGNTKLLESATPRNLQTGDQATDMTAVTFGDFTSTGLGLAATITNLDTAVAARTAVDDALTSLTAAIAGAGAVQAAFEALGINATTAIENNKDMINTLSANNLADDTAALNRAKALTSLSANVISDLNALQSKNVDSLRA